MGILSIVIDGVGASLITQVIYLICLADSKFQPLKLEFNIFKHKLRMHLTYIISVHWGC